MKRRSIQKLLALVLALTMLCGLAVPAAAAGRSGTDILFEETDSSAVTAELPLRQLEDGSGESSHQAGDTVRVSSCWRRSPPWSATPCRPSPVPARRCRATAASWSSGRIRWRRPSPARH